VDRRPCQGLLWVGKSNAATIEAFCLNCQREHLVISGWEATAWAAGPMEPLGPDDQPASASPTN
jgi:hypothetical protein